MRGICFVNIMFDMSKKEKNTNVGTQTNDMAKALRRISARLNALEVIQNSPSSVNITDLKRNIFHTRCGIKNNIFSIIINLRVVLM